MNLTRSNAELLESRFFDLVPEMKEKCPICKWFTTAIAEAFSGSKSALYAYIKGTIKDCPFCHGTGWKPLTWKDYREWLKEQDYILYDHHEYGCEKWTNVIVEFRGKGVSAKSSDPIKFGEIIPDDLTAIASVAVQVAERISRKDKGKV